MYNPQEKRSSNFVCYSDFYKDVYDRAIANKNSKIISESPKIEAEPVKLEFIQMRSIGIGAASSVYLVCQLKTRTIYAMKIIAKSVKSKHKQLLYEEIKIHLRLTHPNIISLYHIYNDEGSMKLILEYGSSTLMDLIKQRHKITQKQAAGIICQILKGVQYIHNQGVTHRDLKLQNILYRIVKICDFGLAKRQKVFESQDLVGTIDYLSPEILRQKKYTYKTDIWAVGVILWQLIHGVSTFLKCPKQSDKYMELIKLDPTLINYQNCSLQLQSFFKTIFLQQKVRANASELLNHKFILLNRQEDPNLYLQF